MLRRTFLALGEMVLTSCALAACGASARKAAVGGSVPAAQVAPEAAPEADVVENDAPPAGAASEQPASTPFDPANAPQLIACVGDSITYGYGVEETRDVDSYPARLEALLAAAGASTRVENYGLCGACALSSGKNPYVDFAEYYDSLDSGADLVVLMLGTNDAASVLWDRATFEAELAERVQAYQQCASAPRLMLMVPPDILSADWAGGVPAATVDDMQQGVRSVAERLGLACVDLEPVFGAREELFSDGVHPNAEGNALIAQAVFEQLAQLG
jgi:lysophospholipase L1-like esterase